MILERALAPQERRVSQRLCGAFNFVNGISCTCLGDFVVVLFAASLGAPNAVVSVLAAMQYAGYLILPMGIPWAGRRGAATGEADFWAANGATALLAVMAALGCHRFPVASCCLAVPCVVLFYGFRAAGSFLYTPLRGDISTEKEAPGVIGATTALYSISGVATLVAITAATRRWHGSGALAAIMGVGALLGIAGSFFLRVMRETDAIRDAARTRLLSAMRHAGGNERNEKQSKTAFHLAISKSVRIIGFADCRVNAFMESFLKNARAGAHLARHGDAIRR